MKSITHLASEETPEQIFNLESVTGAELPSKETITQLLEADVQRYKNELDQLASDPRSKISRDGPSDYTLAECDLEYRSNLLEQVRKVEAFKEMEGINQVELGQYLYKQRTEILKADPKSIVRGLNTRIKSLVGYERWSQAQKEELEWGLGEGGRSITDRSVYKQGNWVSRSLPASFSKPLAAAHENQLQAISDEDTLALAYVASGAKALDINAYLNEKAKLLQIKIDTTRQIEGDATSEWDGPDFYRTNLGSYLDDAQELDELRQSLKGPVTTGSRTAWNVAKMVYLDTAKFMRPAATGGVPVDMEVVHHSVAQWIGTRPLKALEHQETLYNFGYRYDKVTPDPSDRAHFIERPDLAWAEMSDQVRRRN